MKLLSEAIRSTRKNMGMNQEEFSKLIGITQTYLSQIETGAKTPAMCIVERICYESKVPLQVMMWKSLDVNSLQYKNREKFLLLKPVIDDLIDKIFEDEIN